MKKSIILAAVAGAAMLASVPSVFANAEIDINGIITTASGNSGTISATAGTISAIITWNSGGPIYIDMGAGGMLSAGDWIAVSDNNNPGTGASGAIISDYGMDITGNLAGTISSYWSQNNILGYKGDLLGQFTIPSGAGASSANASFDAGPGDYSLTEVLTITSGSGAFSGDFALTVPDSATTLTLLGIGFAGLAAVRSRFGCKA
jgi:hypothetical protein